MQGATMFEYMDWVSNRKIDTLLTGNGALCAAQVWPVVRSEMLVKDRVETACLGLVPAHTILNPWRNTQSCQHSFPIFMRTA